MIKGSSYITQEESYEEEAEDEEEQEDEENEEEEEEEEVEDEEITLLHAVFEGVVPSIIEILNLYPFLLETLISDQYEEERTMLDIASGIGNKNVVEALLVRGADSNNANEKGRTPLFSAALRDHVDVVQLLLDHGAHVNCVSNDGMSSLFLATQLAYIAVVRVLLERGADVNHSFNGLTPLLLAVDNGNLPLVEILLEFGADVDMEFHDKSARLLSEFKGHIDVTIILEAVEDARSKARSQNVQFFKNFIRVGHLPAPLRQWIPLLLQDAREDLSSWVNSNIADEVSCYAAFFQGPSTVSLRRLASHQGILSQALIELLVRRSPATRQLLREVSNYLRCPI